MLASAGDDLFSVKGLLHPEVFPHEVTKLELIETHISWVILTGPFAYKIKKPVQFDFVDYSTLELRKENCLKEMRLNRRFAPNHYLGVVPILTANGSLLVSAQTLDELDDEDSTPVEFAVKMRQFPQDAIIASRLDHPELTGQSVDEFGRHIAGFHDSIESAIPTIAPVQVSRISSNAMENFSTLSAAFQCDTRLEQVERLEQWTSTQFDNLAPTFQQRLHDGLVRRCHGDMHLKNIIQVDGRLGAFDGIEFNEDLIWNDVLSELAFPVMDFVARGRADLGWRLLNAYLESSGCYESLGVLRFYLVYRAMVRAKVGWLNPRNQTQQTREKYLTSDASKNALAGPWDKYLATASHFAFDLKPKLAITHGFSGSGKSTNAMYVMEQEGDVRIRSDVERQRLSTKFGTRGKYSTAMNDWVYAHLLELAKSCLLSGMPVIVDATFLKRKRRMPFKSLADELNVDFEIITSDAPFEELCRRIHERGPDPSEATVEVLKRQMELHDPLTTNELQYARSANR